MTRGDQRDHSKIISGTLKAGKILADILYPPRCPVCEGILRTGEDLVCGACSKKLPVVREPLCGCCGTPIRSKTALLCGNCSRRTHVFDRGRAAFVYEKGLRRAVDRLKFHNRREYVPFFAEAMAQLAMQLFPRWQPAYLIPIPMHAKKKKERGFDQAQLLAEELGRRIREKAEETGIRQPGFEVRSDILVRTRYTRASKQLDRTARKKNLRGVFAVRSGIRLSGAVVLIDDIYTTGTTMDEAARALRAAGAEYIYFLTASIVRGED